MVWLKHFQALWQSSTAQAQRIARFRGNYNLAAGTDKGMQDLALAPNQETSHQGKTRQDDDMQRLQAIKCETKCIINENWTKG